MLFSNKIRTHVKKILLISHSMQVAGAEIILYNLAKVLLDCGYDCSVISINDGPMTKQFKSIGLIPKILNDDFAKYPDKIIEYARCFDLVIANTVVTYMFYKILTDKVPLIWYIHEGHNISEYTNIFPELKNVLQNSKNIYVVSNYAKDFIVENYNPNVKVIYNYVEDKYLTLNTVQPKDDNINFTIIGYLTYRKAIHLCIDAFLSLPTGLREKSRLNIAGQYNPDYFNTFKHKINEANHVVYHGEITGEDKQKLFANTDVFVIPSFDEACSLVALEAAMYGKPLIISKNVGAKYLVDKTNGWIISTGSIEELAQAMENAIKNQSELEKMGKSSREKYLEFASYKQYKKAVIQMIENNINNSSYTRSRKNIFSYFPIFKRKSVVLNFLFFKLRVTLDPIYLFNKYIKF